MSSRKNNPNQYDRCPVCGGIKRTVAQSCKRCQRLTPDTAPTSPHKGVNYEALSPEWLHQFRGLFWGEGSASIVPNNGSYMAFLSLNLREDDFPVIEDIYVHLGGRVLFQPKKNPKHGDQFQWRTTRLEHCKEVCELLLQDNLIPAKKVKDVEAVLAFINYRLTLPRHFGDEAREVMRQMMMDLRSSRHL